MPSQPQRGCAPSAGQDGPLLYPGPLCGGEAGTTGRAAGGDRDVDSFSPGQESGRKARPRLTDLPPMDGRQAPSGVAFLFGYLSLWPRKEKVTRLPRADESSSLYGQASPQAYQLKCDARLRRHDEAVCEQALATARRTTRKARRFLGQMLPIVPRRQPLVTAKSPLVTKCQRCSDAAGRLDRTIILSRNMHGPPPLNLLACSLLALALCGIAGAHAADMAARHAGDLRARHDLRSGRRGLPDLRPRRQHCLLRPAGAAGTVSSWNRTGSARAGRHRGSRRSPGNGRTTIRRWRRTARSWCTPPTAPTWPAGRRCTAATCGGSTAVAMAGASRCDCPTR